MIRLLVSLLLLPFIISNFASSNLPHKPHNVPCSQLIVFGDDLTDDGVEFSVHSHGFVRNSNGPVWPEYLNKMLECDEYTNYAYSGARSDYSNVFFSDWSGILWQIEHHFMSRRIILKDSLIILQAGGLSELILQQKNNNGSTSVDKINENIAHAVSGLINTMDNGNIVIMNLVDPYKAPGYTMFISSGNNDLDISPVISRINLELWRLIRTEGYENRQVSLFDLNAAIIDATRGLNTNEPFTYQQSNMTSLKIFDYAYHNQWYPSTFVHHKIAQKLVKFLEDL
ncbi:unnamed protein product [Cercopithifilaria johnstoni]|uniref:SGNH/GDSL hydrolase family protein n=1 Tax=Cercopithifilaria johnstoni TaxID=2874296 RepID=A0A8J2LY13_9BILA|nr:unnamed protein product [Cercopithifilaria johnstoni]